MTSFVRYQSLRRLVSNGPFTPVVSQAVLTTGGGPQGFAGAALPNSREQLGESLLSKESSILFSEKGRRLHKQW